MNGSRRVTAALIGMIVFLLAVPALAGRRGTDVFLPSMGQGAGISPSSSYAELWVYNPNATTVDLTIYLLQSSACDPTPPSFTETIGPGNTRVYENPVLTIFGVEGFGAFRVVSDDRAVVNARVSSQPTEVRQKDSAGQFFAALPASLAIGLGETLEIPGVHQTVSSEDSQPRRSLGIVETTGYDTIVRVTVRSSTGAIQGEQDFHLQGYCQLQVDSSDYLPGATSGHSHPTAEVVSGSGEVIAFASGNSNCCQQSAPSDETAAVDPILTDATLAGDGTAAAPLGLADDAVTSPKIAAGAVTESELGDAAITTTKLQDQAATGSNIANDAVDSSAIFDGSVLTANVADGAVKLSSFDAPDSAPGKLLGTSGSGLQWWEAVPIGMVIDWWRPDASFPIPDGFALCDGRTLDDPESPLHGMALPDLNERFILGVADPGSIGMLGGGATHDHSVSLNHNHPAVTTSTSGASAWNSAYVGNHTHWWAAEYSGDWQSLRADGSGEIMHLWDNGIDGEGAGAYPTGSSAYSSGLWYTELGGAHRHDLATPGHAHSLDIPSTPHLFSTTSVASSEPPSVGLLKLLRIK